MAADTFTKAFSNPYAWDAVCSLVNVVFPTDVQGLVDRAGLPPPMPEGGKKEALGMFAQTVLVRGPAKTPFASGFEFVAARAP